ncbi:MAG: VanZ family protein [Brachybacterium sp.]|nr:VanZ family protein [Brachybacterium sp.]
MAETERSPHFLRVLAVVTLVLHVPAAAALVLMPDGWGVNRLNVAVWIRVLGPLDLHHHINPEQFAVVMNVLLFVPMTAALAVLRPTWWWVLAGAALSTAIELYQLSIGTRQASLLDVAANTLGAAIGVAIGLGLVRLFSRRSRASGARPGPSAATTPGASPAASAPDPAGAPDDRD